MRFLLLITLLLKKSDSFATGMVHYLLYPILVTRKKHCVFHHRIRHLEIYFDNLVLLETKKENINTSLS